MTTMSELPTIDAVWTPAAQQHVYRQLLHATAYPGETRDLPATLSDAPAWLAVIASICDHATPLADLHQIASSAQLDFLGCPQGNPHQAPYVIAEGSQAVPADWSPTLGTLLSPEQGATVVLSVNTLSSGSTEWELSGPGIKDVNQLLIDGLHPSWAEQRVTWCAPYPRGVELVLCAPHCIAAIPRTTTLTVKGI